MRHLRRLLLAASLALVAVTMPAASSAQYPDACFNDCRITCQEPWASASTGCVDRCGRWSKTTCGSNWNDGGCSPC